MKWNFYGKKDLRILNLKRKKKEISFYGYLFFFPPIYLGSMKHIYLQVIFTKYIYEIWMETKIKIIINILATWKLSSMYIVHNSVYIRNKPASILSIPQSGVDLNKVRLFQKTMICHCVSLEKSEQTQWWGEDTKRWINHGCNSVKFKTY